MLIKSDSYELSTGLLDITRTLYPVPDDVVIGIIHFILSATPDVSVPMFTGVAKLPEASDSCAVNTLFEEK